MNSIDIQKELKNHLQEQYAVLIKSGKGFDEGDESEGKRLATHLRIIAHTTLKSNSLLNQLKNVFGIDIKLLSHRGDNLQGVTFYSGLMIQLSNQGVKYLPMMDIFHPALREISLDEWWNNTLIIIDGEKYTRKDIILGLANKDGGAHVDSDYNQLYYKLTRTIKLFENQGHDWGKFELTISRESAFYMELALKKYFKHFIK